MTNSHSAIVVSADTPEQQSLAEWALQRYEKAGLELPPLTIVFAGRDQTACDGSTARTYFDETPMVKMCWNDRFILLHELAHVWVAENVPPANHAAFMKMRDDVQVWAGTAVPWANRGSEHAANVIAWGLLEKPYPISRTHPNDKVSLHEAFEFLTGGEPLHDGGPDQRTPERVTFVGRSSPPLESGR